MVLTLLGLTLSVITQTEMRMGANERVLQRVFYAADSGFGVSVSRALVQGDFSGKTFTLPDPSSPPAFDFRHSVDVTPLVPVLSAPCNLCQINNAGTVRREAVPQDQPRRRGRRPADRRRGRQPRPGGAESAVRDDRHSAARIDAGCSPHHRGHRADGSGPVLRGETMNSAFSRIACCDRSRSRQSCWSIGPASADDRDLLKFRGAKPYLFILLDTSGSMNLKIGADDLPAVGHGDDPASRIWGAKEALLQRLPRRR